MVLFVGSLWGLVGVFGYFFNTHIVKERESIKEAIQTLRLKAHKNGLRAPFEFGFIANIGIGEAWLKEEMLELHLHSSAWVQCCLFLAFAIGGPIMLWVIWPEYEQLKALRKRGKYYFEFQEKFWEAIAHDKNV